jgi:hypothetical protein
MQNKAKVHRVLVGLVAGLAGSLSSHIAFGAPEASAAPTFGGWEERDMKTHFEVYPGPTPKQVVVVIPKDVTFPGSHRFLLTKGAGGSYEAAERDRPRVSLLFDGPSKAKLSLRGSGTTASGTWISMNDFTLVRP